MGNVIGVTLATDGLFSRCFDYAVGQVKLGRNLVENVETLRNEFDVLMAKKNDVHNRVLREEGPEMRPLNEVVDWLSKVTSLEVEISDLIKNTTSSTEEETRKTHCIVCCSKSCKTRRRLNQKVAQKLLVVASLMSRGEFASVVCRVAQDPLARRNIERTVGLETLIYEVLEHINDDQVRVIGLYGMGGVGKTTLLTEINNNLSDGTHGLDVVIWVRVSENSNIENIQHEIGRKIGYSITWREKSQVEKANDIFRVLSRKSFVLLLDDIRIQFELKDVGVPLSNAKKKSKVVFTTRSLEVCGQMQSQRDVKVKCLDTAEAWELFKSIVGDRTINRHPDILKLAELVAKECGGLPLALIIVGKAMSSKSTPREWSNELSVIKENAAVFTGLEDKVFNLLRLSYDNLSTDTIRNCFLYCSLFPRDLYIPEKKLINYWFGEAFVKDPDVSSYNTIGDKLEGYSIIGTLVNASLLERDENGGVKMHDVIRDMALWLACDCGKTVGKYLVQARSELTEVPSGICNEGAERISLANNSINSLPQVSLCHSLLTLLLNDNLLNMISQGFFESLRGLRVLDLSGNEGITKLPVEISLLVSIQYLNLAGTGITELQKELSGLIRLKFLDLTYTVSLHKIPEGLLLSFKSLRVLKMFGCHSSIFLEETPSSSHFSQHNLQKYPNERSLSVGGDTMLLSLTIRSTHFPQCFQNLYRMSRRLCIYRLGYSHMEITPELIHFANGTKTERLEFTDCGFTTPPLDMFIGYYHLCSLFIVRCSRLENLTWLSFAKSLKFLLVAHCEDIEKILDDNTGFNPFVSLEEMYLIELPKLQSVSPPNRKFRSLRYIGVEGCPKLINVSVNSDTAVTIQGSEDWWDGLPEKPTAIACITDSKENDKKKYESSTSDFAVSSSATASTSYIKFPLKEKLKNIYESFVPVSTSHPDSYLPNFISFH